MRSLFVYRVELARITMTSLAYHDNTLQLYVASELCSPHGTNTPLKCLMLSAALSSACHPGQRVVSGQSFSTVSAYPNLLRITHERF